MPAASIVAVGVNDHLPVEPRRRRRWSALAVLVVAAVVAVLRFPRQLRWPHSPVGFLRQERELQPAAEAATSRELSRTLREALDKLTPLQEQVDGGNIVPKFGEMAQEIISKATATCSDAEAQALERVLDAALHSLFLRQVSLLREQVADTFSKDKLQADTVSRADQHFCAEAQALVREGSTWSSTVEREALRAQLEGDFRRAAALTEERARATRSQRVTVEVISKLQEQMEQLQQKVQAMRTGGSPWVLSTSYRIPKTPLQLIGRYEQGRANIELNLTPDKDPANADNGLVQGIGPANLGVSFNLRM